MYVNILKEKISYSDVVGPLSSLDASDVSSLVDGCLCCLKCILAWTPPTVDTTGEVSEITDTEGVTEIGSCVLCAEDSNGAMKILKDLEQRHEIQLLMINKLITIKKFEIK